MNEFHCIGRLAAAPVLSSHSRPGKPDVALTHFTLAVNRDYKAADGTPLQKTQFLDFEIWDTAAETVAKHCKKGELLMIDRATAVSYVVVLEDGTKVNYTVFRVDKFNFQSVLFGRKDAKKTKDTMAG